MDSNFTLQLVNNLLKEEQRPATQYKLKVLDKAILLDDRDVVKRKKKLNRRERKEFERAEGITYDIAEKLHELWKSYILEVSDLLRADFHGALIQVVKAKAPNYVGLRGIIIKDCLNCFTIVQRDSKISIVPKKNVIFEFSVGSQKHLLFGSNFIFRSHDRAIKKFKSRPTISIE